MLNLRININKTPWAERYQLRITDQHPLSPGLAFASTIQMERAEENAVIPHVAELDEIALEHLINQLWLLGIRPSEKLAPPPQLEALERHLEDMRAIAKLALDLKFPVRRITGDQ